MKNIILSLLLAFTFIGCSSKSDENQNVAAKLVVGKSLANMALKDQHGKMQKLTPDTKVIFFSFSKAMGHACNALLEKESPDFLAKHHALYVADVSPAPSLIKKMFILPDLEKLKFPILLINDDKTSAEFSKGMKKDSIVVVSVNNETITKIQNLKDTKALEAFFTQK